MALKERIMKLQTYKMYEGEDTVYVERNDVLKLLDSQRWIPCSERLPELGERVLCQCQANIYEVLKLTVDGWYYNPNHCYMESFVIAWMPLPQPYSESEEENGSN